MSYCEDYPACGHTDLDPCPGRPLVMTGEQASEFYYCDMCGYSHPGACPDDDYDYDDGLTDVEADAMTLRDAGMGTDEDYGFFGGDDY